MLVNMIVNAEASRLLVVVADCQSNFLKQSLKLLYALLSIWGMQGKVRVFPLRVHFGVLDVVGF
jgi:hypothetical protein